MRAPWWRDGLRFRCTACGACCAAAGGEVALTSAEAEGIRRLLGLSPAGFARRYLRRDAGGWRLRLDAAGRCPFLDRRGRCRVYRRRPAQCRSYPFWPEVLAAPAGWRREARRCEGIGRGGRVPAARIRRWLASC